MHKPQHRAVMSREEGRRREQMRKDAPFRREAQAVDAASMQTADPVGTSVLRAQSTEAPSPASWSLLPRCPWTAASPEVGAQSCVQLLLSATAALCVCLSFQTFCTTQDWDTPDRAC